MAVDPSEKLLALERLDEVVVYARQERLDASFWPCLRREEDDGDESGGRVAAKGAEETGSIEAGHHDIGL